MSTVTRLSTYVSNSYKQVYSLLGIGRNVLLMTFVIQMSGVCVCVNGACCLDLTLHVHVCTCMFIICSVFYNNRLSLFILTIFIGLAYNMNLV